MLMGEITALVYSNFSKTYQFMNRSSVIPLCKHDLSKLYSTAIPPLYPAFSYVENGIIKCVTYYQFTSKLKLLLERAGYAPELFSGHSMRRGGGQLFFFSLHAIHYSFKLQAIGKVTNFLNIVIYLSNRDCSHRDS